MFRQMMFCLVLVSVGVVCSPALSFSAEEAELSPVANKAKSIVEAAHAYVQEHSDDMEAMQKALMTDPRFRDDSNGLYIFMHAYDPEKGEAICCGQGVRPDLIGKNMWNLRTPNGRLLFHEFFDLIENKGKGWIEYEWLHPVRKEVQTKQSYVMKVILRDGRKAGIGCGFWK